MTRRHDIDAFHEAWERGAPTDEHVAELVRTAEQIRDSAVEGPSPDFREALRERLMTEAVAVLVADPGTSQERRRTATPRTTPVRRRLAGISAAAVASVGTITLVTSSAQALPGEMLYPVKLGVESVQLTLKDEGAERGSYQLERATERLREAEALADDASRHSSLPEVLGDFTTQAEDGSNALFTSYEADGDEQDITEVTAFAERSTTVLTTLSARGMPAEYVEAWERAAGTITALADKSSRLCGGCERADVDDLVRSVAEQVEKEAAPPPARESAGSSPKRRPEGSSRPAATHRTSAPGGSGSTTAPPAAPSPTPSKTPEGLRKVTDPLLGGLLGDDEQEGLVPGLLNGLLGNGKDR